MVDSYLVRTAVWWVHTAALMQYGGFILGSYLCSLVVWPLVNRIKADRIRKASLDVLLREILILIGDEAVL